MNRIVLVVAGVFLFLLVSGCCKVSEEYIAAYSASASIDGEGNVVINENPKFTASQEQSHNFRLELERLYQMEFPKGSPEYTLKSVIDINKIELSDGSILVLEGVCAIRDFESDQKSWITKGFEKERVNEMADLHISYLSRCIESEKLVYKIDNGRAYVWTVDYSLLDDPELKGLITEPTVSLINETIVSSGWSLSRHNQVFDMRDKYIALEGMARKANVGIWAKKVQQDDEPNP